MLVELLPRVGGDLVAQQWWAAWAASSGGHPVDLGWYAGSPAVSYSLLAPWVLALTGPVWAGVLSTVTGAAAFTALLIRGAPARPRLAGVLAAGTFAADQLSGRTTFAMGTAVGLAALLVLGGRAPAAPRLIGGALLAAMSSALSPVSGVFLGLAALTWWLVGGPPEHPGRLPPGMLRHRLVALLGPSWQRAPGAVALLAGAVTPLLLMTRLGAAGGPMTASTHQTLAAVLAALAVRAVLGPQQRLLRTGATLTLLALLLSWLLPNPVGSNTTRLVLLFAVPVLVGTSEEDPLLVGLTAALVVWVLPPVVPMDLMPRDTAAADRGSAPLLQELAARAPVGRVEVVPLASHQDALLADRVPLARGWTRQLDLARNPLLYDGTLDAPGYLAWLRARGASYVALSTQRPDWAARGEATLVRRGVPGLTRVWSDSTWALYSVTRSAVLDGPARLVSSDRRALVFDVTAPGTVQVALFWAAQLQVTGPGACIRPGREGTVLVQMSVPGRVVLGSAWRPHGHCTG